MHCVQLKNHVLCTNLRVDLSRDKEAKALVIKREPLGLLREEF